MVSSVFPYSCCISRLYFAYFKFLLLCLLCMHTLYLAVVPSYPMNMLPQWLHVGLCIPHCLYWSASSCFVVCCLLLICILVSYWHLWISLPLLIWFTKYVYFSFLRQSGSKSTRLVFHEIKTLFLCGHCILAMLCMWLCGKVACSSVYMWETFVSIKVGE